MRSSALGALTCRKGAKMGRKPKLNAHQIKEARLRLAKGQKTRDLAKIYGVSISTISRLGVAG